MCLDDKVNDEVFVVMCFFGCFSDEYMIIDCNCNVFGKNEVWDRVEEEMIVWFVVVCYN